MTGLGASISSNGNSFFVKLVLSVFALIISAGVLALFNMNVLLVRVDERLISFDRRLVIVESEHNTFTRDH